MNNSFFNLKLPRYKPEQIIHQRAAGAFSLKATASGRQAGGQKGEGSGERRSNRRTCCEVESLEF